MADNITARANTGSGTEQLATDDIGNVHYPRTKLTIGADGQNDGDVSLANPMPTREAGGANSLLLRILNLLMSPMGFDRSLSRQRVTAAVESGTLTAVTTVSTVTAVTTVSTVTGVTTVGAVTNLAAIDNIQGRLLPLNQNASAWAATVRARIT